MASAKILYANNAYSALASQATASATSLVLQDSSSFPEPGSGELFYLTLTDSGSPETVEVVSVTANNTGTNTLTCSALASTWDAATVVELRLPSEALDYFVQSDPGGNAKGLLSVNIQPGRNVVANVASGGYAVAVGYGSRAADTGTVGIGYVAGANNDYDIAIGSSALASGSYSVSLGWAASSAGLNGVAIGSNARASGNNSVCIGGSGSSATQTGSICIGNSDSEIQYGFVVAGTPLLRKDMALTSFQWRLMGGSKAVIMSHDIELTQQPAGVYCTFSVPTGAKFFPDEVGLIITEASGVSAAPEVSFGWTGTTEGFLAQTAATATAAAERDVWKTLVTYNGKTSLTFSIKVPGSATGTYTGRIYFAGLFVEDNT